MTDRAGGGTEENFGVEQPADPFTGAMTVYDAKTGRSLRRVEDYRV